MIKLLKKLFYPILLSFYVLATRLLRTTVRKKNPGSSALLLPPTSPGSLGDEAILIASIIELTARGVEKINIISYSAEDHWEHIGLVKEIIDLQNYFHYGTWKDRFRFVNLVSRHKEFYFFGTDMMDGFYGDKLLLQQLNLVTLAAKTGTPSTIVGFSYNKQPTPASVKAIHRLPSSVRLCCRDPYSCSRLSQKLLRPFELVADAAFLLKPASNSQVVQLVTDWICTQKKTGRVVMGLNANYLFLSKVANFTLEELVNVFVLAIKDLLSHYCIPLSVLLIPHDSRGKVSDVTLAASLLEAVPSDLKEYFLQIPSDCRADEIKAICGELDIVLCSRMHIAIACLGQGTPVACISYQDKFEGLYQHFGLIDMTIEPEEVFHPGELAQFLLKIIENRLQISLQIQEELPRIQELARLNFKTDAL